jgi:predicted neuraminidase
VLEVQLTSRVAGLALVAVTVIALPAFGPETAAPAIVQSEFVYERAPFPSAHASTIVETGDGLVAAWFGGTEEKNPDVGIWVARREADVWSSPVEVANGVQPGGTRYPCWNPVLFQPTNGPLVLFYKVGPSPSEWWGLARTSPDAGRTWSDAIALPKEILGPIRAKPVEIVPGVMLAGSSTENHGWVVHMERFAGAWTADVIADPRAWERSAPLNTPTEFGAIQPTLLAHSETSLQILCRSRQGVITQARSDDGGRTWGPMTATTLPNPSAGIDAVRLADGRFLLVYNPSRTSRDALQIAVSKDGTTWHPALVLEAPPGEHSYPAMIQTHDGRVHVTYTWKRERIKHVVIDPTKVE